MIVTLTDHSHDLTQQNFTAESEAERFQLAALRLQYELLGHIVVGTTDGHGDDSGFCILVRKDKK